VPSPLVLASRSPQRRAILEQLGVPFEVRPADVAELEDGDPAAVAVENARRKRAAVDGGGAHVLAVDTIVTLGGRIHGKPRDEAHARETLRELAGRTHEVIGGLAFDDRLTLAVTRVTFRALDDTALEAYLATGEWRGRAGGYAIQGRGAALVRGIEGDYLNVVGLPVTALLDLMESSGFRP
jgi:septum formation protein